MAITLINVGTIANDGTGDDLREAFLKVNQNFEELDLRQPEQTTASNKGSGTGIFADKVDYDLQFKSLVAGSNITLTPTDNQITVDALGGLQQLIVVSNSGSKILSDGDTLRIQGGTGANVQYDTGTDAFIITATSVLATDTNPTLTANLNASGFDINTVNQINANTFRSTNIDITNTAVKAINGQNLEIYSETGAVVIPTSDLQIDNNANVNGTITANTVDAVNLRGYFTGDHKGSVFADDSTVLIDAATGEITGTVSGNVTGTVTGDVIGSLTGTLTAGNGTVVLSTGGDGTDATFTGTVTGDVTGNLTGNASTAFALNNSRNFQITGDATAPIVAFNGTSDVNLVMTLDTTGVSAGTYGDASNFPIITVDAKGRVTNVTTGTLSLLADLEVLNTFTATNITSSTITIDGDAIVSGNLTVNGTQTIVNSNIVNLDDAIVRVNSDGASVNAGLEVNIGGDIKQFVYNVTSNKWTLPGEILAADIQGSVFADDSSTIVDSQKGVITADIEKSDFSITATTTTIDTTDHTVSASGNVNLTGATTTVSSSSGATTISGTGGVNVTSPLTASAGMEGLLYGVDIRDHDPYFTELDLGATVANITSWMDYLVYTASIDLGSFSAPSGITVDLGSI